MNKIKFNILFVKDRDLFSYISRSEYLHLTSQLFSNKKSERSRESSFKKLKVALALLKIPSTIWRATPFLSAEQYLNYPEKAKQNLNEPSGGMSVIKLSASTEALIN